MLSFRIVLCFSFSLYAVFYRKLTLFQTKSRSQKRVDKNASETNEANKKGLQYAKTEKKIIRAKTLEKHTVETKHVATSYYPSLDYPPHPTHTDRQK